METTKNMQSQAGRTSWMKTAAGIVGICLAVLGLGAMISLFVDYRSSETTDDAQIEQYLSPVNIRVPGYIKRICFTEHQHVRKGDTLLVLEDDELGIFRYRYTWYSIGIFLMLMLVNSSTLFVTTYLKLSTCSGNLESATVSCWAIPGCLLGLAFTLVCVLRGVHFDTLLCHVAVPDGGRAQCRGSGHWDFCVCQLVAGEAAALHHAFRARCSARQSTILHSICPSFSSWSDARKRWPRGFPLGFYDVEGQSVIASYVSGNERHNRVYDLDMPGRHGLRLIDTLS